MKTKMYFIIFAASLTVNLQLANAKVAAVSSSGTHCGFSCVGSGQQSCPDGFIQGSSDGNQSCTSEEFSGNADTCISKATSTCGAGMVSNVNWSPIINLLDNVEKASGEPDEWLLGLLKSFNAAEPTKK